MIICHSVAIQLCVQDKLLYSILIKSKILRGVQFSHVVSKPQSEAAAINLSPQSIYRAALDFKCCFFMIFILSTD